MLQQSLRLPGTLVLPAGQTTVTLDLVPFVDELAEGTETIGLTLLNDPADNSGKTAAVNVVIAAGDGPAERMVRVGERLPLQLTLEPELPRCTVCGDGEADPHWWHGIGNALFASDLIRAEFARLRPVEAGGFAARAQALQQRLFALQAWASAQIRTLPPERRHLFTTHDAFGHLARDYDFTLHPLAGLSTEAEPDARRLVTLVKEVRRLVVKAVFAEGSASSRLIETLAAETGVLVPPSLYADGPGAPGSGAETYEAMYRHNLSTIVSALR